MKKQCIRQYLPSRGTNASYRKREYLTVGEVDQLIEVAKSNRYGHRDATLILVAFRHGLRAVRGLRAGMVSDRLECSDLACAPGQAWQTGHSPDP
jgi:hypothetical protein